MEFTQQEMERPKVLTYSEKEGKGVEDIVRCDGCSKLIVLQGTTGLLRRRQAQFTPEKGCPNCGSRRFHDVKTLRFWEFIKVRTGWIDFPDRAKLLAEFSRG